jgi:outer membrane lipoprotein SlyB
MTLAGKVALLALLGVAGCAQAVSNTATPAATIARPAIATEGTILSLRVVTMQSDQPAWRVALLADASGATTPIENSGGQLTEFIVQVDGGATISVVQINLAMFRPGDRVVVLHDGQTHIARPG